MKFEQLKHLIAVAEAGSFRRASVLLRISQPALTQSVKHLEEELKATLLQRTPRGVFLTDFGAVVVKRGRSAFTEIERLSQEIDELRGNSAGKVRVAVSPIAAISLVPNALRRFKEEHPGIVVTVIDGLYPKVLQQVRDRSIDIAIGPIPDTLRGADLRVEELFKSELRICCRRRHPLVDAESISELQNASWANTGPAGGPESLFEKLFEQSDIKPPRAVLQFESITALLATATNEDLLFGMPEKIIEHPFYSPYLAAINVKEKISPVPIYLLSLTDSPLPPAANTLATAFRRTLPT